VTFQPEPDPWGFEEAPVPTFAEILQPQIGVQQMLQHLIPVGAQRPDLRRAVGHRGIHGDHGADHGADPDVDKPPIGPEDDGPEPGQDRARHEQTDADGIDEDKGQRRPQAGSGKQPAQGFRRQIVAHRRESDDSDRGGNEDGEDGGFDQRLAAVDGGRLVGSGWHGIGFLSGAFSPCPGGA